MNPVHPWDRQPDEKDSEWAAFSAYRDAGLHRTFQQCGLPLPDALRLAPKHRWITRTRAYDVYVEAACAEARVEALKATAARMGQDAAEAACMGIQAGANGIRAILSAQAEGNGTAQTLDAKTAMKLVVDGAKLGLLLGGKPTENLQISLADLTPEEIAALRSR